MAKAEGEGYRVIPDVAHGYEGTDLTFCGIYDHIYYYPPLDVYWVRYWDTKSGEIQMFVMQHNLAQSFIENTDLPFSIRETIFEREYNGLVETLGEWVTGKEVELDSLLDVEVPDEIPDWLGDGSDS